LARLIVTNQQGKEVSHSLGKGSPELIVGRAKSCAIRTKESTVSREHARITWDKGIVHLVDLGSSNGTFFKTEKIEERYLDDGDVFHCGSFRVRFELDQEEREAVLLDSADILIADSQEIEVDDNDSGIIFGLQEDDDEDLFPELEAPESPGTIDEAALPSPDPEPDQQPQFDEFNRQLVIKDEQLSELRIELKQIRDELDAQAEAKTALQADIETLQDKNNVPQAQYDALGAEKLALEEELKDAQQSVSERGTRLKALENQILKLGEGQPSARELNDLRAAAEEKNKLLNRNEELSAEIVSLKATIEAIESQESAQKSAQEEADKDIAAVRKELEQAQAKVAEQQLELTAQESSQKAADKDIGAIRKQLTKAQAKVAEQQLELTAAEASKKALEVEMGRLGAAHQSLLETHEALAKDRDDLHAIAHDSSPLEALEKQVESLNKQIGLLEEERDVAQANAKESQETAGAQAKEIAAARQQAAALEQHNDELKELMATMPDAEESNAERKAWVKLEKEHKSLLKECEQLTSSLSASAKLKSDADVSHEKMAAELEKALDCTREERDAFEASLQELKGKSSELEDSLLHAVARSQLEQVEEQLATLQKELDATLNKAERESARADELVAQLKQTHSSTEGSEQEIAGLKIQLSEAKAELSQTKKALNKSDLTGAKAQDSLSSLEADLKSAKHEKAALEQRQSKFETEAEQLRQAAERGDLVPTLQSQLEDKDKALSLAQAELAESAETAAQATDLANTIAARDAKIESLKADLDDLKAASRGQMKRISELLKEKETLGSASSDTSQLDAARNEFSALQEQFNKLELEKDRMSQALEEATQQRSKLRKELEAAGTQLEEAASLKSRLEAAQEEVDRLSKALDVMTNSTGENLAADAALNAIRAAMEEFVDELNSAVSVFRQNCETVALCLEDIKQGQNIDDNHLAATEILQSTQDDIVSIKKSLRKIRQEQLS
jgi:chromosome segregation ATPase